MPWVRKTFENTFWDEPSKWYIFVQMKMWRYYTQSLPTDRHGTNWNNMEQLNLPSRFVRISSNFYPKSSTAGLGSEKKSIWSISAFLRMPSHGVTPLVTTQFILRVLNLYTFTHWRSGRLLEDPGKTCKKHKPSVLSSFGAKASENDNLVLQVVVLSNTTESGSSTKVDAWTDLLVVFSSILAPRPTDLSFLCSFRTSRIMKFSHILHEWNVAMFGYKYDMTRNRDMLSLFSCNRCWTKTYKTIRNDTFRSAEVSTWVARRKPRYPVIVTCKDQWNSEHAKT